MILSVVGSIVQTKSYCNSIEEWEDQWEDGGREEEEKLNDGLTNAMNSISYILKTEFKFIHSTASILDIIEQDVYSYYSQYYNK